MRVIKLSSPAIYRPSMSAVPLAWADSGFDTLDFGTKERLQETIIAYLDQFEYAQRDSLVLYPTDFAFHLFVALYRAISERTSADRYVFFNWPDYVATLKTLWDKAEHKMVTDTLNKDFCFVFDLMLYDKRVIEMFCKLLNSCYIGKIKLFVATRIDAKDMVAYLPPEIGKLYESKVLHLGMKT